MATTGLSNSYILHFLIACALSIALLFTSSCSKDDDGTTLPPPVDTTGGNDSIASCSTDRLPIVMVHGFLGSGDTYALQALRFSSNDYCRSDLHTYDWNSLGSQNNVAGLDQMIDAVLQSSGKAKVNLIGHSAGGGIGYDYLSDSLRSLKVHKYIHIASTNPGQPAGPVGEIPTLNIWSDGDEVNQGSDINGATNLMIPSLDHYQILTSAQTFEAMYAWFVDSAETPAALVANSSEIEVSGKAVVFGENAPVSGGTVEIYAIEQATGFRINADPDFSFTVDPEGFWGPFDAISGQYYEFKVIPTDPDDVPVHYYREPFVRSNSLVYLRTMPPPGSLAGVLLSSLPRDDNQAVLAVFASNQAVIHGRDELFVDGTELSTDEFASADQTAIAFFLFDDNDNQQSDMNSVGLFAQFPFMNGIDMFFPASVSASINMTFNGRSMNVPAWPSDSEGYIVPVFD